MSLQDSFDKSGPRKPCVVYTVCARCQQRPPRGEGKVYCDVCTLLCPQCNSLRDCPGRYCRKCRAADRRARRQTATAMLDRELAALQRRSAAQQAEIEQLRSTIRRLISDLETVQKIGILNLSEIAGRG